MVGSCDVLGYVARATPTVQVMQRSVRDFKDVWTNFQIILARMALAEGGVAQQARCRELLQDLGRTPLLDMCGRRNQCGRRTCVAIILF
jgi:hypothetical protein